MNDATPKRDRSSRSRYLEDEGVDTFYDVTRNTIADDLKSTSKTYHSALRSTTPKTMAVAKTNGVPDAMIYNPKQLLLSGRRHAPLRDSQTTKSIAPLHVSDPQRQSFQFDKSLKRFETYAHPNKRPTKLVPADFFKTSHRDGNVYRFASTYR